MQPDRSEVWRGCCVVLMATALAAGCTGGSEARLVVEDPAVLIDSPIGVRVENADPGAEVVITASTVDERDLVWESRAVFEADADGSVDLGTDEPIDARYTGARAYGLLDTLRPVDPATGSTGSPDSATGSDAFALDRFDGQTVTISAIVDDAELDAVTVQRQMPNERVDAVDLDYDEVGFVGRYFAPTNPAPEPQPAVVMFGGSNGGFNLEAQAQMLAAHEYPTLGLTYWRTAPLPANLDQIPLEYFVTALRWLAEQPGVDPERLTTFGLSYGGGASLLLGLHFPDLVYAVASGVGSATVSCSLPDPRQPPSAWSLRGEPLPCNPRDRLDVHGYSAPESQIPIEEFAGPVFLACGGKDNVWPSCDYQAVMAERLGDRDNAVILEFPEQGHEIGSLCDGPCWDFWSGPYAESLTEPPPQHAWRAFIEWVAGMTRDQATATESTPAESAAEPS